MNTPFLPKPTDAVDLIPLGIAPLIDAEADLAVKHDVDVNSWFAIGHFDTGTEVLDYLYHIMITPAPGGKSIVQGVISITNESTGWYKGEDVIVPLDQAQIGSGFDVALPNGRIYGTLDDMRVEAKFMDGSATIDLHLSNTGKIIFNGGTGVFPLIDHRIHQYSVPRLASRGTITIEGVAHDVEGVSWFDRQWQNAIEGLDMAEFAKVQWSWMDINLDSGDSLSVWCGPATIGGEDRAWATVLHSEGSQSVVAVEPGFGARDYWHSPESGARYPTRWTVRIPAFDAVIEVEPRPREQEIISKVPVLNKYEGASKMTGSWKGNPVTGFGYVELVGGWN